MKKLGTTRVWNLKRPEEWAMPDVFEKPLPWQDRGLSYTATGYGSKIPSRYMIKLDGKMRRVYTACYGNATSDYVEVMGERVIVELSEVV